MQKTLSIRTASILKKLKGGLVASCQPVDGGTMDHPKIVTAMAQALISGGAVAVRIEGVENLKAVRQAITAPIIGIVKSDSNTSPVRITVFLDDVKKLVQAGADVVAYDATDRFRHDSRDEILKAILDAGVIAMADCSTLADCEKARDDGAIIIGTTLSGYTQETEQKNRNPDFELIRQAKKMDVFVMAEGRFDTPELASRAIRAGADAVTVGTALTRLEIVTERFAKSIRGANKKIELNGFAVDLGGTKTAVAKIETGKIFNVIKRKTIGTASYSTHLKLISEMLSKLGYRKGDLLGVAVTGRVDEEGRWSAVNQSTLGKFSSAALRTDLIKNIGPSSVINDALAATLAEHQLGSGEGHQNFAFITISTGVGGGLILNGRLHTDASGLAGHVGFSSSPFGNTLCNSNRYGTLESVASGNAIASAAVAAGYPHTDAHTVFEKANAGEAWALKLVDRSATAAAELAADLVTILGITKIAFGGSIGLATGYLDRVRKHLDAMPQLFHAELVTADLAENGPLMGALLNAKRENIDENNHFSR